jgi:hypothetical protein
MNFGRMTLVNIYADIRNYLTGVEGFSEEYTLASVKAHLDIFQHNLKNLEKLKSGKTPTSDEGKGLLSSLLDMAFDTSEDEPEVVEEKPKKKRGRPKKTDMEVA